jgi:hypothetical protein
VVESAAPGDIAAARLFVEANPPCQRHSWKACVPAYSHAHALTCSAPGPAACA